MTENEKNVLLTFLGNKIQVFTLDINQSENGLKCELKPVPAFQQAIINHLIERGKKWKA